MKRMILYLLLSLGPFLAITAQGQRKPELNDQVAVDEQVTIGLAQEKAHGKLAATAMERGLNGSFTFDLTVDDKGATETVFPVESTLADVQDRNAVKACLMGLRFAFKVPKGKRFKTRQTLTFP